MLYVWTSSHLEAGFGPFWQHCIFLFSFVVFCVFFYCENGARFHISRSALMKKCGALKSAITFYQYCMFPKWKVQLLGHSNNSKIRILSKGFMQTWYSCKYHILKWNDKFSSRSKRCIFICCFMRNICCWLFMKQSTAERREKVVVENVFSS